MRKRLAADFYDIDDRAITRDDILFYVGVASAKNVKNIAREIVSPVHSQDLENTSSKIRQISDNLQNKLQILDIGCGTGRVAIPLATCGFSVTAIDYSEEMLEVFSKKLEDKNLELKDCLNIVHADMRTFDLDKKFDLILLPYRVFHVVTAEADQILALTQIKKHLANDGICIFHVLKTVGVQDDSWLQNSPIKDLEKIDEGTGKKIVRYLHKKSIDKENQVKKIELEYVISTPDGQVERVFEPLTIAYYFEDQLRNLLESQGFRIIQKMGYFDGRSIEDGTEMIFVCTLKK